MAERLAKAQRPLILAGGGALAAGPALAALAEHLQAPVALTINAKGLLPASHPLQIGSTQSLVATRALVAEADVVLAIGTELAETDYDVTFKGGFEIPGSLLRIDIDPDQTVRNYLPELALVADAEQAAEALLAALQALPTPALNAAWGSARAARLRRDLASTWDQPTLSQTRLLTGILEALPTAIWWATRPNRCTPAISRWTCPSHGAGSTPRPATAPWATPCRPPWAPGSAAPKTQRTDRLRFA